MTSCFGDSHDPGYIVFEKKILHRCLSRILSTKFRNATLKSLNESLNGVLLFLPSWWLFFCFAIL